MTPNPLVGIFSIYIIGDILKFFWFLIKSIIALIWSIPFLIFSLFGINFPNPWTILFHFKKNKKFELINDYAVLCKRIDYDYTKFNIENIKNKLILILNNLSSEEVGEGKSLILLNLFFNVYNNQNIIIDLMNDTRYNNLFNNTYNKESKIVTKNNLDKESIFYVSNIYDLSGEKLFLHSNVYGNNLKEFIFKKGKILLNENSEYYLDINTYEIFNKEETRIIKFNYDVDNNLLKCSNNTKYDHNINSESQLVTFFKKGYLNTCKEIDYDKASSGIVYGNVSSDNQFDFTIIAINKELIDPDDIELMIYIGAAIILTIKSKSKEYIKENDIDVDDLED